MKFFNIEARMALAIFATTVLITGVSFFFMSHQVQEQLVAIQIDSLLNPIEIKHGLTIDQLVAEGISKDDLQKFTESQQIQSQGFLAGNNFEKKLIHVRKEGNLFSSQARTTGIASWIEKSASTQFALMLGLAFLAAIGLFILGKWLLNPIKFLRRTTEDILAGKFEVRIKYRSSDEIGQTFEALKRLCAELERRDKALESVSELATTDGLTGLKNHRSFKEFFKTQLSLAQRHKHSLGFLILDVDHFKKFNDTYGHQQGDEVLKAVGQILKIHTREGDLVARYGGEEFVIIFCHTDYKGFSEASEKLRKNIEACDIVSLTDRSMKLKVTASFGGIFLEGKNFGEKEPPKELAPFIEVADQNLYQAKKAGRNRTIISKWAA